MDGCCYYAWNLKKPPTVFLPFFYWSDFFHHSLTNPSTKLEYDKSQTIYFLPCNSGTNFTESVFVIDNYIGSSIDWQIK